MMYFHNISRIMDCVECEKCRVYGKMQTYGLGAALKILLNDQGGGQYFTLERNEIIVRSPDLRKHCLILIFQALVNTFIKFATSIHFVDKMFARRRHFYINMSIATGVGGIALILFLWLAWRFNKAINHKVKKQYRFLQHFKED